MNSAMKHTVRGIGFFLGTCVLGVVGYRIAGWNLDDAIYMVVITIFGVGYGEVRPVETAELRMFTSGLIVTGYGAAVYAVGGFVQFVAAGEINRALGARRMTKEIGKLSGHTIVCGYGRVGQTLTNRLLKSGCEIVVVDSNPARIVEAEAKGLRVVTGDAAEESVLQAAGIEEAAQLATVLSSDAANVFVTLTATGITRHLIVIARAEDPASESKLIRSGADHVILPAAIGADRIANLITRPSAQEILGGEGLRLELGEELGQLGLRIEELTLPQSSPLIGKPVRMIEVGGNHGFLIVGLVHPGGEVDVNPEDSVLLREGDKVIVMGHSDDLPELRRRYELSREVFYRGARVQ